MKKTLSVLLLTVCLMSLNKTAHAQFDKGDKQVNVGIGLGTAGLSYGGLGYGLNASAEYGIMDNIGVGLHVAYARNSYGILSYNYSANHILFGPRGSYHFNDLLKLDSDKFDIYASAGILLDLYSYTDNVSTRNAYTSVVPMVRVGGRYFMSDKFTLFADLGTGGNNLQAGISFQF
jgi:hypothetical protein